MREGDSVLPLTALTFGWDRPPSETHRNWCHGDERAGEMGVGVAALAMGLRHRTAETLEKDVVRSPRAPAVPCVAWGRPGQSGHVDPTGTAEHTGRLTHPVRGSGAVLTPPWWLSFSVLVLSTPRERLFTRSSPGKR